MSAAAMNTGRRRSSRRRRSSADFVKSMCAAPPWNRHYNDIFDHCRLSNCTKRILRASDKELEKLPTSLLADAITVSTNGSKSARKKQEGLLVEYTQALISRQVESNDTTSTTGETAVFCAAYYGYTSLLELLLVETKASVSLGYEYHPLATAVERGQHGCIQVLLRCRANELSSSFLEEDRWSLYTAIKRKDITAIQLLRDEGKARLSDWSYFWLDKEKRLSKILHELYPVSNIHSWSKEMHWSFPTSDRHVINWIWHHVDPSTDFPPEVWLNILSFVGRGWWMDPNHRLYGA